MLPALIAAAVQTALPIPACSSQPPFTISRGTAQTYLERLSQVELFYGGCHGQEAIGYLADPAGGLRRRAPGQPAARDDTYLLLHVQYRSGPTTGVATATLTYFFPGEHGEFCHFRMVILDFDARVRECWSAMREAAAAEGD